MESNPTTTPAKNKPAVMVSEKIFSDDYELAELLGISPQQSRNEPVLIGEILPGVISDILQRCTSNGKVR